MARIVVMMLAAAWPFVAAADDVAASAGGVAGETAGQVEDAGAEAPQGTPDRPYRGDEVELSQFLWTARPVVVFAETEADPSFQRQMELLRARPEALAERDVVVIVDTDPGARSSVRTALRPRGFMLAIIGKDGQVELRKPSPWDVREISRTIDKMPLRIQEIRDRSLSGR
jgi:hypothetical protein